jgi:hypothetical protein
MTPSQTPIEQLADDIVRQDVAAQAGVPAWDKPAPPSGLAATSSALAGTAGRSWLPIVLLLIILLVVGGGATAYALLGGLGQPPATFVAASPTQPSETATQPAATATQQATATTTITPTATATATGLAGEPHIPAVEAHVAAVLGDPAALALGEPARDTVGDTYLPHDGSPDTADQPYIDLVAAWVVRRVVTAAEAVRLSSFLCGAQTPRDGVLMFVACNQQVPLAAGEYVVFVTYHHAPPPLPFPTAAQCVYILQFDSDADRTTGFTSPLEFNHLIGADVYYENLHFVDANGDYQNYILGTDHARPARPDTNEIHGNLPTGGRWFASQHETLNGPAWVQTAFLPAADVPADQVSMGGFCNANRSVPTAENFSVDAMGNPADTLFPMYLPVP